MKIEASLTIKGFNDLFEDKLSQANTIKAAYYLAENWHEENFGGPKYTDYSSFASSRSRYLKKRKQC